MRTLTFAKLPPHHACTYLEWQYTHVTLPPPLHTHTFHELFWVIAGTGIHVINGESRALTPGLLVLIRADDVHGFSADPAGAAPLRFVNFGFRRELWDRLWRRHLGRAPHALRRA